MNIYIYSDESGVFDQKNGKVFVFGGLIFLEKKTKNDENRKYIHVEKVVRKSNIRFYGDQELKATFLSNKDKGKMFRSLNKCIKFGIVVDLKRINKNIFNDKKTKQRYLDYAFKIGVKRAMESLIQKGFVNPCNVTNMHFYCDEHTTATNGHYELREGLEEEFKRGTYNFKHNKFFPPLFPNMENLNLTYHNSTTQPLIRAADIVANRVYFMARRDECRKLHNKINITYLP